jgi:hypothetical protein
MAYKFRGKRQRKDAKGKAISCDRKICWWSKERARQHADEVNQRLIGDRKVRAYKCVFAPKDNMHWHVGREPKKCE